ESEQGVMSLSDIVVDVVQILLKETAELADLGFEKTSLFLQVVGVDEFGVWAAHPNYVVVKVNDAEGKPLPRKKQVKERVDANFLIRWEQIGSIVHFPDREGFDYPSPFEKHIGFVVPTGDREEDPPSG
ncbi:MAG: hypothetical protein V3U35_00270, partial [Candidatus Neomarinimicrobiota bacterium]